MTTRTSAAIYARISEDKTGEGAGVARQLEDCRDLLARHPEWTTAGEYIDNDISATNGKHRPEYERLMAAVRRGEVQVIIVYMQSRFWRNRRERAEGLEILKAQRIHFVPVQGAALDMTKSADRMMVGLLGEFDTFEVEVKSERQRRGVLQAAQAGAYHGPTRPYGYRIDWTTDGQGRRLRTLVPDPEESQRVREAAERIAGGESVRSVVLDWDARGIKSLHGGRWSQSALTRCLLARRNVGVRDHEAGSRDANRRSANLAHYEAAWPPILDRDLFEAVTEVLTDPGRRTLGPGGRVHLLAGFARCGRCGVALSCAAVDGKLRYRCPARPRGCGGVGREAQALEREVLRRVFHWLEDNGLYDAARASVEGEDVRRIRAERRTLQANRREFSDYLADKVWSLAEYKRQCARVDTELARLDRALSRHVGSRVLDGLSERGEELREVWQQWEQIGQRGLLKRREVIAALVDRVVVHPTQRGASFDPDRVQVFPAAWAEQLPAGAAADPEPVPPVVTIEDQVLAYLAAEATPVTRAQIAQAIGCAVDWVGVVLRRLDADGRVRRAGRAQSSGGQPPILWTCASDRTEVA